MISGSKFRNCLARTGGLAALALSLLLGVLGGTALGAPTNTALPIISPSTPEVGSPATASTGSWTSEAPVHWQNSKGVAFEAGKSIAVTERGGPITFAGSVGGVEKEITCELFVNNANIENPSGGGSGVGTAELEYKGCVGYKGTKPPCIITVNANSPVNLQLIKVDGDPRLGITPVGEYIANMSVSGKSCPGAGNFKIIGEIKASYLNPNSRLEFTVAGTAGGALRFNGGQKATAEGAISVENTATGEAVQANSLTYAYQWKRCSGGCTNIEGATGPTYTPTKADLGKTLTVVVTATDSNGSTAAESLASGTVSGKLSWYAETSPATWTKVTSKSFTSDNLKEGSSYGFYLGWVWGGVLFKTHCSNGSGSGWLTSTATKATIEGYKLTLTGCNQTSPGACQLTSSEIKFNSMTASSVSGSITSLNTALTFAPTGSAFFEVSFKSCPYAGPYKIVGAYPGQYNNGLSAAVSEFSEVQTAGTMRFQEAAGPIVGFDGLNRVQSEGKYPVKLDVGP